MNDQQQPPDTTRHDNAYGIDPADVALVAAFTKRIGNELYTVDHQNVGSSNNIKALQLDQKKILANVPDRDPPRQEPATNVADSLPVGGRQSSDTSEPVTQKKNTETSADRVLSQVSVATTSNQLLVDLEQRLTKVEHTSNAFRKARRIKRGINYSVSSNGFKGVIKDAELLAEFIITEVAKGAKTITIRANDSQNSKQK